MWGDRASGLFSTTTNGIEIPLGPGGNRIQSLRIGTPLENHVLIVGGSGSGKSNLMHVIITGMALRYPPSEIEMYLVDFKGGVEFKRYATWRLPHARAVAVESEREFGISILRALIDMKKRREDLFRSLEVNDFASYRAATARIGTAETLKRVVLLVDEFQIFFVKNDTICDEAKTLLNELATQGRSAGIHIILGSQSLSGSMLLPTTEDQINVRIVLSCSDDEAKAVLGPDQHAARSLTRPGEAIYSAQGDIKRFQVSLMHSPETALAEISKASERWDMSAGLPANSQELVIFEGNRPPPLNQCEPITSCIARGINQVSPAVPKIPLGESVEIKPAIEAKLGRYPGANILAVTRDEHDGASICLTSVVSMAAQMEGSDLQIHHFEMPSADEPLPDVLADCADCFDRERFRIYREGSFLAPLLEILGEVRERHQNGGGNEGRILVVFQGLQRMREFRRNGGPYDPLEEGGSADTLEKIIREGPEVGIHVVAWCDSLAFMKRNFGDAIIGAFGVRLAGRMTLDDSNTLLQSSAAYTIDKDHRMCSVNEDYPGKVTRLRPYAFPSMDELNQIMKSRS
jgi:hypothetical protein